MGYILPLNDLTLVPTKNIVICFDMPHKDDKQQGVMQKLITIDNATKETQFEEMSKIQDETEYNNDPKNDNGERLPQDKEDRHTFFSNKTDAFEDGITNIAVRNETPQNKICLLEQIVIKPYCCDQKSKETNIEITTESKQNVGKDAINEIGHEVSLDSSIIEKKLDPFQTYLTFPEVVKIPGKARVKLPSAISSQAWRDYYLNKEREKVEKAENIKRRKEQRITIKKEKEAKNNKKNTGCVKKKMGRKQAVESIENNMNEENINKPKTKCVKCEEDLISDTEDDNEKNIGCDYCTKWYHLRCTEFFNLTYEVASLKEYTCDTCKEVP